MKNPRTRYLTQLGSGKPVRLLDADRAFMRDLAKLGILDVDIANKNHYSHLRSGAERSLERLEKAGFIKSENTVANRQRVKVYTFASKEISKAWGGDIPIIGCRRSHYHELITSRLYYELGQPEDYRVAGNFTDQDISFCNNAKPDAMFTNEDGEVVFVEADSGQYTKNQIRSKMMKWQRQPQVWGQPSTPMCRVPGSANVQVFQI